MLLRPDSQQITGINEFKPGQSAMMNANFPSRLYPLPGAWEIPAWLECTDPEQFVFSIQTTRKIFKINVYSMFSHFYYTCAEGKRAFAMASPISLMQGEVAANLLHNHFATTIFYPTFFGQFLTFGAVLFWRIVR